MRSVWRWPCVVRGRDSSLGSRRAVHVHRVRQPLPRSGCAAFDGIGRRCLRQCDGREFLCHAGMRVAGSQPVQNASRGAQRRLRVHRRLLQSASAAFVARISVTRRVRATTCSHALSTRRTRSCRRARSRQGPSSPRGRRTPVRPTLTAPARDGLPTCGPGRKDGLPAEQKDGLRKTAEGGHNAVKADTLIPNTHLSTKPGQVQPCWRKSAAIRRASRRQQPEMKALRFTKGLAAASRRPRRSPD